MTQKIMDMLKYFAIVVVTILCAWNSLTGGRSSASASYEQPFVVDIRMPGIRTFEVCYSQIA